MPALAPARPSLLLLLPMGAEQGLLSLLLLPPFQQVPLAVLSSLVPKGAGTGLACQVLR